MSGTPLRSEPRRRLLVLCYFFPPLAGGGVHRVLSFVRELPRFGWDCTVICAGRNDYWVTDQSLEARIPAGTEVIRVSGGSALSAWLRLGGGRTGRRSGSTFSWLRSLSDWWLLPDSYAGWARRAARAARRRLAAGGIDAMLSSSPPDSVHLAALRARGPGSPPWLADFRDPWIGLYLREPPSAWHRALQAALERRVLEGADRVLVASRTHAEQLGERCGARPRAVTHLPNGYTPDEGGSEVPPAAEAGPHFVAAFTGTLSMMPETEVFLEAVHELLARRPEWRRRFRARLAGPFDLGYQDRAVALGLRGIVEFTGPLTHAESRALQRAADLLLLWKPPGMPTMVPGKLYEYLASGSPVVAMLPAGDEAAELAVRGGATRIDPGDRSALSAELERRCDHHAARGRVPGVPPVWLEEHARPRLAGRLARELDALIDASPRGGPA
ncbi:MAG: glycosyltransferase [Candidatus Eisenbacteria bacterium]